MIILGIDPSLNSTGYGLIEYKNSRIHYLESGIIKNTQKTPIEIKLLTISEKIENIIQIYKPFKSGIEETFVNNNFQTSLKLGMVRGVILTQLAKFEIPIVELSPNLIKKNITGYGKAKKDQVSFMIMQILSDISKNHEFKTEDETDAIAIAITALNSKNYM